jgi:hypothetical protein
MKSYPSFAKISSLALIAGSLLLLPIAAMHPAAAQTSTPMQNVIPPSEEVTLQAKITAINPATREVKLVGPAGNALTVTAGPLVRLNLLKVGQTVNAQYYRSVAFNVSSPTGGNGVPVSNDQVAQVIAQPAQAPGGIAIRVIKISGTVVGIDLSSHTISVVNPSGGGVYTIDVVDPARIAALPSLNVGDTITAVISEVVAISIQPAPKRLF